MVLLKVAILVPTLFNIMVNDLSSCIKNCEMSQFADDGAI